MISVASNTASDWSFDVLIIDDEQGLVLGRPDLIIFRDRSTAAIGGYGLGFEEPSYAAFVQGLRHTIYPKEAAATLPLGMACVRRTASMGPQVQTSLTQSTSSPSFRGGAGPSFWRTIR